MGSVSLSVSFCTLCDTLCLTSRLNFASRANNALARTEDASQRVSQIVQNETEGETEAVS